jgi:hypothetical protein
MASLPIVCSSFRNLTMNMAHLDIEPKKKNNLGQNEPKKTGLSCVFEFCSKSKLFTSKISDVSRLSLRYFGRQLSDCKFKGHNMVFSTENS